MSQNATLPLDPDLWVRLPPVRPFGVVRRWRAFGVSVVALLALIGMALVTGLATPRLGYSGGGGSTSIDGGPTDSMGPRFEFVLLVNSSLRPWRIEDARVDGDKSVSWDLQLGHDVEALRGRPVGAPEPRSIGIGERFAVVVALPDLPGSCADGEVIQRSSRIEVAIDGPFGRRWVPIGSSSTSSSGCPIG